MALLPAIPARPDDRPETFDEYQRRRAILVMWRRFNDRWFSAGGYRQGVLLQDVGSINFNFEVKPLLWRRRALDAGGVNAQGWPLAPLNSGRVRLT